MAATEIERGEVDKLPHVPGVDAAKLSLTAPKCMETQEKGEISAVVEGAPYQTIPATPMAAATVTGTREAALVWGVEGAEGGPTTGPTVASRVRPTRRGRIC